jgi:hypothetical protein
MCSHRATSLQLTANRSSHARLSFCSHAGAAYDMETPPTAPGTWSPCDADSVRPPELRYFGAEWGDLVAIILSLG